MHHVSLSAFFFEAVNSCSVLNGGCEHKCVDMGNDHYKCECRQDFQLKRDGRHCECKSICHQMSSASINIICPKAVCIKKQQTLSSKEYRI